MTPSQIEKYKSSLVPWQPFKQVCCLMGDVEFFDVDLEGDIEDGACEVNYKIIRAIFEYM